MPYAEDHMQFCPEQNGFRNGRSCETQLLGLIDEVTHDPKMWKQTDLVIMDFAKAFDGAHHSLLIHKLQYCSISKEQRLAQ